MELESVEGETLPLTLQAAPGTTSGLSDSPCVCDIFLFFFYLNNTFHFFELDLSCLPTLGRK